MKIVLFFVRFSVWPFFVIKRCYITKKDISLPISHFGVGMLFLVGTICGGNSPNAANVPYVWRSVFY